MWECAVLETEFCCIIIIIIIIILLLLLVADRNIHYHI